MFLQLLSHYKPRALQSCIDYVKGQLFTIGAPASYWLLTAGPSANL